MHSFRKTSLGLATSALALLAGSAAHAQVVGFGTGATAPTNVTNYNNGNPTGNGSTSTFIINDGGCCSAHPYTTVSSDGSTLNLGNNGDYATGSAFTKSQQGITTFTSQFTFTPTGSPSAGFAFVLQDDPRGAYSIGANNGADGYGSNGDGSGGVSAIRPSFGAFFQFSAGGVGFTSNANPGGGTRPGVINLASGDPIQVNFTYDGTTFTELLLDTKTLQTYNASTAVNLGNILGANTAYVGFSNGGNGAKQNIAITNFSFIAAPEPSQTAALGLGVLGLSGLALVARKRRPSAC